MNMGSFYLLETFPREVLRGGTRGTWYPGQVDAGTRDDARYARYIFL